MTAQEQSQSILIVDDEADIRSLMKGILEDEGYRILTAANSAETYQLIDQACPDLMVLDIWLQNSDHDGIEILKVIRKKYPDLPVIMISGHGTIETAVSSIKLGAYDFIEKPFKSDRLILMIRRALEASQLRRENISLRQMAAQKIDTGLNGKSIATQGLRQMIEKVATTNSRVLITGEPGTGKENAARLIHKLSSRKDKPMFIVNCATMQADHVEEELFGSELVRDVRVGLLEQANGGTLLFDEISDLPLDTQAKLLRVLQEQLFSRVGGKNSIKVDVRFLASTNRDLEDLIDQGKFRKDLYYRLNVVPLRMPCLKERIQDLPELVKLFASEMERYAGLGSKTFSPELLQAMQASLWPGNIRQLRNAVEWMMIMSGPDIKEIGVAYMPPNLTHGEHKAFPSNVSKEVRDFQDFSDVMMKSLREAREEFERHYLLTQIERFEGNVSKTAKFVGMERSALHRKLKLLQVSQSSQDNDTYSSIPFEKRGVS